MRVCYKCRVSGLAGPGYSAGFMGKKLGTSLWLASDTLNTSHTMHSSVSYRNMRYTLSQHSYPRKINRVILRMNCLYPYSKRQLGCHEPVMRIVPFVWCILLSTQKSKSILIGHALTLHIQTGNWDEVKFFTFAPHGISSFAGSLVRTEAKTQHFAS